MNLVKYFEALDFEDKLRLSIDMIESYHVKVENEKVLEILNVQLMKVIIKFIFLKITIFK